MYMYTVQNLEMLEEVSVEPTILERVGVYMCVWRCGGSVVGGVRGAGKGICAPIVFLV